VPLEGALDRPADAAAPPIARPLARGRSGRLLRACVTNPGFLVGLMILVTVVGIALLAPWLYPGDPQDMVAAPAM